MKITGFNLLKLTISNGIRSRELNDIFLTFEFQESLYNPFLFGEITILDTLGIIENFPIIGNERITMIYQLDNPSTRTTIDFVLYKINNENNAEEVDRRQRILTMHVCGMLGIQNKLKRISKYFNSTPDKILNDIFKEFGINKNLTTTNVTENIKFISNYWTFANVIKYLITSYKTDEYVDFVFYETSKSYYFKPLSELLTQDVFDTLTFSEDFKYIASYSKIKYFNQKKMFNILKLSDTGLLGKTTHVFSMTEYGITEETKTMFDVFNEINTLGAGIPFNENVSSIDAMIDTDYENINTQTYTRGSQNLNHFEVRTNGDINREVGQLLYIHFKTFDNNSETNEFLEGKWLLTTMKHMIKNDGGYEQNLLLTKNAFFNTANKVPAIENNVYK